MTLVTLADVDLGPPVPSGNCQLAPCSPAYKLSCEGVTCTAVPCRLLVPNDEQGAAFVAKVRQFEEHMKRATQVLWPVWRKDAMGGAAGGFVHIFGDEAPYETSMLRVRGASRGSLVLTFTGVWFGSKSMGVRCKAVVVPDR